MCKELNPQMKCQQNKNIVVEPFKYKTKSLWDLKDEYANRIGYKSATDALLKLGAMKFNLAYKEYVSYLNGDHRKKPEKSEKLMVPKLKRSSDIQPGRPVGTVKVKYIPKSEGLRLTQDEVDKLGKTIVKSRYKGAEKLK